jgi:tetratricopeptide (TPR) repeat protein
MIRNSFGLLVLLAVFCMRGSCQDMAPLAPLVESEGKNSLMDLLKGDLLKQYQDAQAKDKQQAPSHRRPRPRPELGKGQYSEEPIDISKYIGTEGDPNKAVDKLRELGKIPPPQSASLPENASDSLDGMWKNAPPEKRFEYAQDLFERRKYEEAQRELEQFLAEKPKDDAQFDALLMREKCLYHRRFYDTAQNDYYRLKSFYPKKEKEIEEFKNYLEEKSGIAALKKKLTVNRADPAMQKDLLAQYEKFGWLDFAEDFFLKTIKDTSPATAKSLCEIYYKKADYEMLATLSRAALGLHPGESGFLYNEGVALYMLGDPASRSQALERFQKVVQETPEPRLRKNAQWYIDQMNSSKKGK